MRPFRPLLPANKRSQRPTVETPKKRRKIALACDVCRQRKSKCDGMRPACDTCTRNGTVCQYTETEARSIRQRYSDLQQSHAMHEELVELLRTLSERDVAEVVRRLRAGMNVASIVSHVRDGDLLMQLSLVPETRRVYEFPYKCGIPSYISTADNQYLDSLLYKAVLCCQARSSSTLKGNSDDQQPKTSGPVSLDQHVGEHYRQPTEIITEYHRKYLIPYHAARMIEPIVDKITATPWTCVISDNQLLRRLLCSYFYYPHPCGPFVHKDLFFRDMAAGLTRFCSPLLVNAMLAIAVQSCHQISNRSKVWLPDSLTYKFIAEARRLWDLESTGKSQITSIQAGLILSYTTTNNSLDKIGTVYLEQAIEMSRDLDLFGPTNSEESTDMSKARIFTAWAVFSWQAQFDYYFFRPPHLEQPPQVPLPDPEIEPQWYGEIWAQYPSDQTLTPLYLGHKLKAEATLHTIMNEMGLLSFGRIPPRSLALDEIAVFKRKLDYWKNTLPKPLQPAELVFPSHLNLHVQYHQLVIALMKLIHASESTDISKISDLCAGRTPLSILNEANILLETIMRLYYVRHGFESYDPWVAFTLTIIGNEAIVNLAAKSSGEPRALDEYRSTVILSAQGLNGQSLHYHLGTLLAIQLQSAMKADDLQLVQTFTTAAGISSNDEKLIAEHSHSQWPIPIIGIHENPEQVRLKHLIEAFEEVDIQSSSVLSEEG